jgi:hypothetical protein
MDELAGAERDADMRGSLAHGFEEHEISGLNLVVINLSADRILLASLARESCAMLCKHPLDETAAVKSL